MSEWGTFTDERGVYEGELVNGVPHGRGKRNYPDGAVCEGTFWNGRLHGHALCRYEDGSELEGVYEHGFPVYGTWRFSSGDVYEGYLNDDEEMAGFGTYFFEDGRVYTGRFEGNASNGKGEQTWPDGTWCLGDWVEDELTGHAVFRDTNDNLYDGAWQDGARHGYGVHFFADGDYFEGSFSENRQHGEGRYTFADRRFFTGTWEQNEEVQSSDIYPADQNKKAAPQRPFLLQRPARPRLQHERIAGKPILVFEDRPRTYIGDVDGDVRTGYGRMCWENGHIVYEGEWRKNRRSGHGFMLWTDGSYFDGEWKDDRPVRGTYVYRNGEVYRGEMCLNSEGIMARDGKGELHHINGCVYTGQFQNEKKHGRGVQTWPSGITYNGIWQDGNRHGRCVQTWADGQRFEGRYANDKMVDGRMQYADGRVYEGAFWMDENWTFYRQGQGKMTYADGACYVGEWHRGLFHGQGKMTYADGAWYAGDWVEDKKNGHGEYHWADGDWFEGTYVMGSRTGFGTFHFADGWHRTGYFVDGNSQGLMRVYHNDGVRKYFPIHLNGKKYGLEMGVNSSGRLYASFYQNGTEIDTSTKAFDLTYAKTHEGKNCVYTGEVSTKGRTVSPCGIGHLRIKEDNAVYAGRFRDIDTLTFGFEIFMNEGRLQARYGNYVNGRLNGQGFMMYEDGCYEGPFVNGRYHGTGTYYHQNGKIYTAIFENGTATSLVRVKHPDGKVIEDAFTLTMCEEFQYLSPQYEDE